MPAAFGERHGHAKLTDEKVYEAKILRRMGFTTIFLAHRYGVTPHAISAAVNGVRWTHVPDPPPIDPICLPDVETLLVWNRFWKYVEPGEDGECWEWRGTRQAFGYGTLYRKEKGKSNRACRTAYELFKGPIPDGLVVMHMCDNPPCVNPQHLTVGTRSDNTQDAIKKGRLWFHRGENIPKAKLTREQVIEIRRQYANGDVSYAKLARCYGVGESAIKSVLTGRTWGWLTDAS